MFRARSVARSIFRSQRIVEFLTDGTLVAFRKESVAAFGTEVLKELLLQPVGQDTYTGVGCSRIFHVFSR